MNSRLSEGQDTGLPQFGEVRRYWGEHHGRGPKGDRDFEMFVKGDKDGYFLAVKTQEGDWEKGDVTERWSPNPNFYQYSEQVSINKWPVT